MSKGKTPLWRILVFILSALFIVAMWVQKDIVKIYKTMPKDQIAPIIVTTVLVTLLKVALIAGVVFFLKWIIEKMIRKNK